MINTFSGITGAHLRALEPGAGFAAVTSLWQSVTDLIGSELEPYASRSSSRRLTTCAICLIRMNNRVGRQGWIKNTWGHALKYFAEKFGIFFKTL